MILKQINLKASSRLVADSIKLLSKNASHFFAVELGHFYKHDKAKQFIIELSSLKLLCDEHFTHADLDSESGFVRLFLPKSKSEKVQ